MPKCIAQIVCLFFASSALAAVNVAAPSNGSTVSSPVHYSATAGGTSCSKGIASMGIYTKPGLLAYVSNGATLSADLTLSAGTYNTVVEQWDYCGGAATTPITITVSNSSGVHVTAPTTSTVGSPVHYAATATSTCSKGVASMGVYTSPGNLAYVQKGSTLSADIPLSSGNYNTTVEEWDYCGGAATAPVSITVGGNTLASLQASKGWGGYGELPPNYAICPSCGSGVTWSMAQGVSSPSLSGKAAKFSIGGKTPYSDALWNNHLIGDGSTQGLPDTNETLTPSIHNFTYDAYFYGTNLSLAENIEFDIAQFFNNTGYYFGTQCQIVNGQVWGVWDPSTNHWITTSVPCKPVSNSWNHVTIQFERTSGNKVMYKSFTLNGVTTNLGWEYPPYTQPGWFGVVVNFQLDGNSKQSAYSVYLDNLSVSYQ